MDALLALVRDRPAAFTTQPISREFDEAGVKRDRRRLELREREHVRNRPTRLLRPIRLRRIVSTLTSAFLVMLTFLSSILLSSPLKRPAAYSTGRPRTLASSMSPWLLLRREEPRPKRAGSLRERLLRALDGRGWYRRCLRAVPPSQASRRRHQTVPTRPPLLQRSRAPSDYRHVRSRARSLPRR